MITCLWIQTLPMEPTGHRITKAEAAVRLYDIARRANGVFSGHRVMFQDLMRIREETPVYYIFGSQSAGKSSVIAKAFGIPLPTGIGTCTRFPTWMVFSKEETEVRIVVKARGEILASGPMSKVNVEGVLKEVFHRYDSWYRETHPGDRIVQASLDCPFNITFYTPAKESFAIIDLPGFTTDWSPDTRGIFRNYLTSPNAYIIFLSRGDVDHKTDEARDFVMEVDPDFSRTVLGYTWCDKAVGSGQGNLRNACSENPGFLLATRDDHGTKSEEQIMSYLKRELEERAHVRGLHYGCAALRDFIEEGAARRARESLERLRHVYENIYRYVENWLASNGEEFNASAARDLSVDLYISAYNRVASDLDSLISSVMQRHLSYESIAEILHNDPNIGNSAVEKYFNDAPPDDDALEWGIITRRCVDDKMSYSRDIYIGILNDRIVPDLVSTFRKFYSHFLDDRVYPSSAGGWLRIIRETLEAKTNELLDSIHGRMSEMVNDMRGVCHIHDHHAYLSQLHAMEKELFNNPSLDRDPVGRERRRQIRRTAIRLRMLMQQEASMFEGRIRSLISSRIINEILRMAYRLPLELGPESFVEEEDVTETRSAFLELRDLLRVILE